MSKLPDDVRLDDIALGPEFSTRIMNACAQRCIETVGQLRERLPEMEQWKGLGRKSINEVKEFFHYNDAPPDLFKDPEYVAYRFEDVLGTCFALMHDVQNHLVRAALKRAVSADTRNHLRLKLLDAASKIEQLPLYGE